MEERDEDLLARIFEEFLEASEQGRDIGGELCERAGPLRERLAAKIRLHRELSALSRELGISARMPDAAQRIGRFHILGALGRGGISRVLLAHDPKLGRRIALKVLDREELLDKNERAWILNEARSLARLEHPGVIQVFEVGETETHSFIAMELLPSPSLEDVIQEWLRLRSGSADEPKSAEVRDLAARLEPYSARIELLARCAEALSYCHDHGILHRDIKPQNVLFDAQGWPKLIDFGLAHVEGADEDSRLGLTQALVGTAAHLAPEQVSSDKTGADPRSDQFSFGTLAYECLALENPFQRKARRATLDAIEAARPEPLQAKEPALPPDLALVVHHALARTPEERYPNMAALAGDLRAILASRPISVSAPSPVRRAQLWLQRHRRGVTVASVALSLAFLFWVVTWSATTVRRRGELLEELDLVRPAAFTSPVDFLVSFQPLYDVQQRAREFESGWLRALLWGGLRAEVDRVVQAWDRALGDTCEHERDERKRLRMAEPEGLYPQLFLLDTILCPGSRYNEKNRKRGTVILPREQTEGRADLFCLLSPLDVQPPELVSAFRSTPKSELLVPGIYRHQVWELGAEELLGSVTFYVPEGWPEQRKIELCRPRAEYVASAVLVPAARYPLHDAGKILPVPRFRILDHLVTVGEFEAFLADTGHGTAAPTGSRERVGPPLDDPVWCNQDSALEFAAWAGGRLPTLYELKIAEDGEYIPRGVPSERASGEYLLGLSTMHGVFVWQVYSDVDRARLDINLPGQKAGGLVGGKHVPAGFRIVFEADRPEVYQHLAEHPLE